MTLLSRFRQALTLLVGLGLAMPLMMGQGCPMLASGGSGPSVVIRSPSLDQTVAVGQLITVVYDAVDSTGGTVMVTAFRDRDGVADSGDEEFFGEEFYGYPLPGGQNKFVQIPTVGLAPGILYVGITASGSSGTSVAYASALITLVSGANVTFTSPVEKVIVGGGLEQTVPIQFDAGVTDFLYRVYRDVDRSFNGNETTITEASSPASPSVSVNFKTTGLLSGTYYIGVAITTSTGGSAITYAPGWVEIVPQPFVEIRYPTVGMAKSIGDPIQVVIAASDPSSTDSTVLLFYDTDNRLDNGYVGEITAIAINQTGATWSTKEVLPGSYYVGAVIQNKLTTLVVDYSDGPVQLGPGASQGADTGDTGKGGPSLMTISAPRTSITLYRGQAFLIKWTTSLKSGEGTASIFLEPDRNHDGAPDGSPTRIWIAQGIDARTQNANLEDTYNLVGIYFVGIIITPNGGSPETTYAPGTLVFRPWIFWVGDLGGKRDPTGTAIQQSDVFQGAVFRGYNHNDNLGSAMIAADDYNSDGRNEILLAAQFGKPFIYAQGGRGAGEAYMIYGQAGRYTGDYDVNTIGAASVPQGSDLLPGLIFPGIVPNPNQPNTPEGMAGNSIPYTIDGEPAEPYATEGLGSITAIPDQDGDGLRELVFGFPWCNSYSIRYQVAYLDIPGVQWSFGRLENNGHFLRGGVVIVSSRNSMITDPDALSNHARSNRVLQLHEVGQRFSEMRVNIAGADWEVPNLADNCPADAPDGVVDTVIYPCEGFWQDTINLIDPPRLADPLDAMDLIIDEENELGPCYSGYDSWYLSQINLSQIDPPPGPGDPDFVGGTFHTYGATPFACDPYWPASGWMNIIGTGFYAIGGSCGTRNISAPMEPFGCRILGQTTTQLFSNPRTTANRFGYNVSISGNWLLIGAPMRTVESEDVPSLPTLNRAESGEIYMLQLTEYWNLPVLSEDEETGEIVTSSFNNRYNIPSPHNYIIEDVGYNRYDGEGCYTISDWPSSPEDERVPIHEVGNPFHIVGASPGDRIGDVTGLYDINNDGLEDFAVGGTGTNNGRGAVYIIYRRQPEVEGDYLLEHLQLDPYDPNRLNGMMIVGDIGEDIGGAIAGGGPANDDYNGDGYADLLIGVPNASPAGGYHAGQVLVLFGGKNLVNPAGGSTIPDLVAAGNGMLITGANAGDLTGTTVANAGDVDGDGISDILISAPEASPRFDRDGDGIAETIGVDLDGNLVVDDLNGDGAPDDMTNAGLVYVVFGGSHLTGTIGLEHIGSANLPGAIFVGKKAGDRMGGGVTQGGLLARGVASGGDIDGDGKADLLIGAILADPQDEGTYPKVNAGEVYLVYGYRFRP